MNYKNHSSYKIGVLLSNIIWQIVEQWNFFSKDTLGKQITRSADSISSNIAEGWNRYYKKDKILFFNYSKSSFYETCDWIEKAKKREMIPDKFIKQIDNLLNKFPKEINGLIKGTRENLKY